jgi:hypothetical protein
VERAFDAGAFERPKASLKPKGLRRYARIWEGQPPNTDHKFMALVPVSRGTQRSSATEPLRQRRVSSARLRLTAAVFWTGIAYDCASKLLGVSPEACR